MLKSKFITSIFQKYLSYRDIRTLKNNLIYYFLFRIIRKLLSSNIILNIYNFKVFGSINKYRTSYFLLKKCEFGDIHELETIKKFSSKNKILFFDCGSNYGFYSLHAASLSKQNEIISIEASNDTFGELIKNLNLNNFSNIKPFNYAVSDIDGKIITLKESRKDWESSLAHQNYNFNKSSKINTIKIDTLAQDYELDNYKVIIKLDIEGNEIKAIEGSLRLIEKSNPLIIIEFSKYIFNKDENIKYLKNFLIKYDYSIYDTKNRKQKLENILIRLNNLEKKYQTIGNFYLIKNSSIFLRNFLNNE